MLKLIKKIKQKIDLIIKLSLKTKPLWYVDWALRYAPAVNHAASLTKLNAPRILDVGSNNYGMSVVCDRRTIGVDLQFSLSEIKKNQRMIPIIASAFQLPFKKESFDLIACIDSLEHMPARDRYRTIYEILRVLGPERKAFIAFPSGEPAEKLDERMNNLHLKSSQTNLEWYDDHRKYGLPSCREIEDCLRKAARELDTKIELSYFPFSKILLQRFFVPILLSVQGHDRGLYRQLFLRLILPFLKVFPFGRKHYRYLFIVKKVPHVQHHYSYL